MTHWEIAVSGHSNFGTDQTNIVSYESWHLQLKFETSLRLLRLIVWPQEVSEVTKVKMKKKYAKIVKSPIFDSQKCNIAQKKPHENRDSYLMLQYSKKKFKMFFVHENIEKLNLKSSIQTAVFFSVASTAQNSPEFNIHFTDSCIQWSVVLYISELVAFLKFIMSLCRVRVHLVQRLFFQTNFPYYLMGELKVANPIFRLRTLLQFVFFSSR